MMFLEFQTFQNGPNIYKHFNIQESKLPINIEHNLQKFEKPQKYSYVIDLDNQLKKYDSQNANIRHKSAGNTLILQKQINSNSNSIQKSKNKLEWNQNSMPVSGIQASLNYPHFLTKFQMKEIKQYKEVYYLGHKIIKNKMSTDQINRDTEEKQYVYLIGDHIAYRYQILEYLGKGAFGQVFKVYDHKKQQFQALKIIKNKKKYTKQAYIQINILLAVKQYDREGLSGIIKIKDFVEYRKHICIMFELLNQNLYQLLKKNQYNGLEMELIRRFAIQILNSLKFLKELKIIHCDLKPENILLKQPNKSGIKIIDFGSSCFENQIMYSYIQSRYYRAPQISLGIQYNCMVDMWSFGCILVQLYCGLPLFPGSNEFQQMKYMINTLGMPSEEYIKNAERKNTFFNEDMTLKDELIKAKTKNGFGKSLKQIIMSKDQIFLEFIEGILKWNPKERLTPQNALKSKWIIEGLPQQFKIMHKILNQQQKRQPKTNGKKSFKDNNKELIKIKEKEIENKSKSNHSRSKSKEMSLKLKDFIKFDKQSKNQTINKIVVKAPGRSQRLKYVNADKIQRKKNESKQFLKIHK